MFERHIILTISSFHNFSRFRKQRGIFLTVKLFFKILFCGMEGLRGLEWYRQRTDWPECAAWCWGVKTEDWRQEPGAPRGSPGNQDQKWPQYDNKRGRPVTADWPTSISCLLVWRGGDSRRWHSWCYYCRCGDQYRPSPWQSPRHVTMVSVVMTGGHGDISSRGMSGSSHLASLIPSPTRHLINICENRDGRDTQHQHRKKQGLYLM